MTFITSTCNNTEQLAAACKSNGTFQTTKTHASLHLQRKTVKGETSKEMAGDSNITGKEDDDESYLKLLSIITWPIQQEHCPV